MSTIWLHITYVIYSSCVAAGQAGFLWGVEKILHSADVISSMFFEVVCLYVYIVDFETI